MPSDRLDVSLARQYPAYSRGQLQKLILAGHVKVNGLEITSTKHQISESDFIEFRAPETSPLYPVAKALPLDIIYEDEVLLVLNKPIGLVVHPQSVDEEESLVQAVLAYFPAIKEAVYDINNPVSRLRPGVAHRLDKNTSGVIVMGKTREALHNLAAQFQAHTVEKEYQTLLYGTVTEAQTVDAPIKRKGGGEKNRMGASHNPEEGRAAVSHFTPQKSFAPYPAWPNETITLTSVKIETGRTHQIRVHAKFIGHPVIGDRLYGNKPSIKLSEKIGAEYQLLHAASLCFQHPQTGKRLCFTAPLPAHFAKISLTE